MTLFVHSEDRGEDSIRWYLGIYPVDRKLIYILSSLLDLNLVVYQLKIAS